MEAHPTVLSQHMTGLEHCDASHVRAKIPGPVKFVVGQNFFPDQLKALLV